MACIIQYMEQCETISNDMSGESNDILLELFKDIRADIENAVSTGWLTQRNIMYINDIEYMYVSEERFKRAGDNINTIIHFVKENESEAPTEECTRGLIVKLGELQTKLHNKSEYYN